MSGPVHKFALVKKWGKFLRDHGFEPQKMSCEELEFTVEFLLRAQAKQQNETSHAR